jgi:acid phosphatase (class A)
LGCRNDKDASPTGFPFCLLQAQVEQGSPTRYSASALLAGKRCRWLLDMAGSWYMILNMKSGLLARAEKRPLRLVVAAFWLVLWLVTPLLAGERYLAADRPDGVALLAPPPAPNSAEQVADLASARAVFQAATPVEQARAEKDASLSLFNFAPAIGPFFQPGRFPKMEAFFETLKTNISEAMNIPKDHWKRPRPYELDPALKLGKPEKSFAYPSGHATRGAVQSLLLAELFPEKREAILAFGRDIGWDRVLIGKHFPTDIYAGRVLGQAIVRELMANSAFQRDLAEAKAEVQSVQHAQPVVK